MNDYKSPTKVYGVPSTTVIEHKAHSLGLGVSMSIYTGRIKLTYYNSANFPEIEELVEHYNKKHLMLKYPYLVVVDIKSEDGFAELIEAGPFYCIYFDYTPYASIVKAVDYVRCTWIPIVGGVNCTPIVKLCTTPDDYDPSLVVAQSI